MSRGQVLARVKRMRQETRGETRVAAGCALVALAETRTLAAARRLLDTYQGWPNPELKTLALELIEPKETPR